MSEAFRTLHRLLRGYRFASQKVLLRLLGARIGADVRVFGSVFVAGDPRNLVIGDHVTLSHGVFLNCRDRLTIGDGCNLSSYAKLYTASLDPCRLPRRHVQAPTTLGRNVWIASNALVGMGVTVGDHGVLAASSVLLTDMEANALYAGIPARKVRDLDVRFDGEDGR
jgi:acetyltransferase-like isoleucine patch superfamily enzyme